MDYNILKTEVQTDPSGLGYAQHLPDSPGMVVELLNKQSFQMVKSRIVSARAVLAECVDGATILDKFEAAAASNSAVKWAVRFLGQEAGIDVGSAAAQRMISVLTGPVLTEAEGKELKDMALQPASRAEILGLGAVTVYDLIEAGV